MNEDNIIFQPDVPKTEDVKEETGELGRDAAPVEPAAEDSASPRVFDFSSDFNISPVADEAPASSGNDTKIGKSNALPPSKPSVPVAATTPVPATPKPAAPAAPAASYRETIDTGQKWPFAFSKSTSEQPLMNPSATAAANVPQSPMAASSANKSSPSSQPVKTIRSEGGDQASEKELQHPKTDLQRDILAILPNMKKGDPNAPATKPGDAAAPKNPLFTADSSGLKPLRTYEGDVAEVLSHRNMSSASIAIAENKKKTGEETLGNAPMKQKSSFSFFKKKPKEPLPEAAIEIAPRVAPKPEPAPEPIPVPTPKPASREAAFRQDAFPMQKPPEDSFKGAVIVTEEEPKAPSHFIRNVSLMLLSVALIGGGLYGGYYLYTKSALSVRVPTTPAANQAASKSLIPSDSQVHIASTGQSPQAIAALVRAEIAKPQNPNTIKEIVITQTVAGAEQQISPTSATRAMNIPAPDIVLRTIQSKWMLGVYADVSGTKNTFIAATTDNFQNALSGMLQWEKLMPHDLQSYLSPATTTPIQGTFIDEIVKNKDVRAFVAPESEQTLFLYSFVNDSMLVVSDSELALSEIVNRLENQAFVR